MPEKPKPSYFLSLLGMLFLGIGITALAVLELYLFWQRPELTNAQRFHAFWPIYLQAAGVGLIGYLILARQEKLK